MDIDSSAIHEVPPPPSSAVVRFGLEMDMTMKNVSDFSHTFPITAEYQSRIDLTREHEASGDIEQKPEGDWDLDARNPRNWPLSKKWVAVSVVSAYTVVAALVSSMMAPALPEIAIQYHITNDTEVASMLAIYMLSYAFSPLLFAPLSEMFGRTWVLHVNNLLFMAFNLGCAFAPSKTAFNCFRFLSGWAGGSPNSVGGGIVGDLFAADDRAVAMAIYTLGPVVAPAIGPAIGGYMTQTIGWRYLFIFVAGLSAIAAVGGILSYHETYAPVIRRRILLETGATGKVEESQTHFPQIKGTRKRLNYFFTNLRRPFMLLTTNIICFVLSSYMALMYGIYFLMFTTFPGLFNNVYHFGSGVAGLAYFGVGMGFIVATAIGGHYGNKMYRALAARNNGQGKPEMRIPAILFGSVFVPIGLFWYGWSAEAKTHWIMPIIGTTIFGFGTMMTLLPIHLYLVDTFIYAASALSAASVSRCLFAFAFPLFGGQMFDALGLGVGNSLLAAFAIVMGVPFPIFLWFYGERLRARSNVMK